MKLLIVRHAIAMDRDEYQSTPAPDLGLDGSSNGSPRSSEKNRSSASRSQIMRKPDSLRPLTPEGIRKMRKNARGLGALIEAPSILVSSPLTRALQTAELLKEVWRAVDILESNALKPDSKPADLVKWLRENIDDEAAIACLIGHEPHLTELIGWFLTGSADSLMTLKKGGACLLEFDALPSRGAGRLVWHATPAMLRGLQ